MSTLTAQQSQAVSAHGNVLLVAGAGTGKTSTLVERTLQNLRSGNPPASLDELLLVTFTEKAAAEMRQRLRLRLMAESADHPADPRWQEQLALFETANIGTLHSLCFQLVRQHFYELELDPQVAIMPEEETHLLAQESLDRLFEDYYSGEKEHAQAVQELVHVQGRGREQNIRALILRIYHYTQTLPNPENWISAQLQYFGQKDPARWQQWLLQGITEWRDDFLPRFGGLSPDNAVAAQCANALRTLGPNFSRAQAASAITAILSAAENVPYGKKKLWLDPLRRFLGDATFLASLAPLTGGKDPLAEDWGWVRPQMSALLQLTREFSAIFADAKRELAVADFHDLEQFALRLLRDPATGKPSAVAESWRRKFRHVLVDEYQDINAAQDSIIAALSREGADANRFLVGDVKQSIYRFRLADPRIFQQYLKAWRQDGGTVIPLTDNFRSRENILNFVNAFFGEVMREELGGLPYDDDARLRFGAPAERQPLGASADTVPSVELLLRLKLKQSEAESEPDDSSETTLLAELAEADKEARRIGQCLLEMKDRSQPVWDNQQKVFRPVQWRDMAVLLRAPGGKSESYAIQFDRLGIPLSVARGAFYDNLEVSDLLNLLQVLDNPLQDLPLLAVLRGPLVGLTLEELAEVRLAAPGRFWAALVRYQEEPPTRPGKDAGLDARISAFLERHARWRILARQASLSRCLEDVLAETHYAEWLLTQPRGRQRQANVQRLLNLAQQFDQFQRQGLFRYLKFIEAQRNAGAEPDAAPVIEEDAVQLMSIHQSKGLEFPVVAVGDLSKPFNEADLRQDVMLDEDYALCPHVQPPGTASRYPSLPVWLATRRQHRELLAEEMRLLYVAMTRARDRLFLCASVSENRFATLWREPADFALPELLAARCYSDWLGRWFARAAGPVAEDVTEGSHQFFHWQIFPDEPAPTERHEQLPFPSPMVSLPKLGPELKTKLRWQYPFDPATRQPAKVSVTAIRRRAAELLESETTPLPNFQNPTTKRPIFRPSPTAEAGLSALDTGSANHLFLQHCSLDQVSTAKELREEARRLHEAGVLSEEEVAALDLKGIAGFWASPLGHRILSQSSDVHRELEFTARLSLPELARFSGEPPPGSDSDSDFVVVQGSADLALISPKEILIVDFKTDRVSEEQVAARAREYEPQINLYATALSRIYQRPVKECWLYFLSARQAVQIPLRKD